MGDELNPKHGTQQQVQDDDVSRPVVLVIEDDPNDWELYGKILLYNGFDVLYAIAAREGLQLARRHQPDLILLDLGLPDMDGLDLCRELREHMETVDVMTVALTARSRADYERRARAAGCIEYLEKPVRPMQVLREVERLLGRAPSPGEGRPPTLRPDVH